MRGYYTYGFINQTMRPIIEKNEGLFAHPYLDTVCKTTIGVGANIDKAELNVDMMYNMGQPKFDYKENTISKGFPKFWDYLAKRNVDGMIKQSKRGGISKDRNDETANYLRQLRHFKHWKKPLE